MNPKPEDRREFFRDLARTGLFGGLTGLGALLAWRRWRRGACTLPGACQECVLAAGCPLQSEEDPS